VPGRSVQKDGVAEQSHDAQYIPTQTVQRNESIGVLIGGKKVGMSDFSARLGRRRRSTKDKAGNEQRRTHGREQRGTRHYPQHTRHDSGTGTAQTDAILAHRGGLQRRAQVVNGRFGGIFQYQDGSIVHIHALIDQGSTLT
jgi:hypothetical protein